MVKVTKDNFNDEVMKARVPVLIDFYADWCGPCRMMSPIVDEIADEREDILVCKVYIDLVLKPRKPHYQYRNGEVVPIFVDFAHS